MNFWGSQYWKNNSLSGVNNAPASMKGYIDNAPSYTCGTLNWTSDSGQQLEPAGDGAGEHGRRRLGSTINQSGSTEHGNIKHLVVVHTCSRATARRRATTAAGRSSPRIC